MKENIKEIHGKVFYYRVGTPDEVILKDEYQLSRYFIAKYHICENDTILDIGAHIGVFAIYASQKVDKGMVYAIEPNQENFELLKKNTHENNLTNIKLFQIGISNFNGKGKLYLSNENWGHSLKIKNNRKQWEEVNICTLEDFIVNNKLHVIDYMKMNIEGSEYDIIYSTPKNILKHIKSMHIEFHPSEIHTGKELFEYVKKCGFLTMIKYDKLNNKKGWITATLIE